MRDGIVISPHWDWEAYNIPERNAVALASLGMRILYCAPVRSVFRHTGGKSICEVHPGVMRFLPRFISDRANRLPGARALQVKWISRQIAERAEELRLERPVFFYNHLSGQFQIAEEMKQRGLYLVHVCQDYPEPGLMEHVALSDQTLVTQKVVFDILRPKFGEKVSFIPDAIEISNSTSPARLRAASDLDKVPRPRLGYLGSAQQRLNKPLIQAIFERHPEWHFVTFGNEPVIPLPNVHALRWHSRTELRDLVDAFDVGFMPYDCANPLSFHCLPLKRLDYFQAGLPVVSTPILCMAELGNMVYVGGTGDELSQAICAALAEKPDDPKRKLRKQYTLAHSISNLANRLREALPLN
jgi:hypothetical protein